MYIDWVMHYFVEEGQNDHFHLRFRAKLQGGGGGGVNGL